MMDSGDTVTLLEADVDAEDDVCFRSKNFLNPARCFSSGVQNVDTFEITCAYFLAFDPTVVRLGDFAFSSSVFDGVKKFRTSRLKLGSGSFYQ
jgi:hypothetical protein